MSPKLLAKHLKVCERNHIRIPSAAFEFLAQVTTLFKHGAYTCTLKFPHQSVDIQPVKISFLVRRFIVANVLVYKLNMDQVSLTVYLRQLDVNIQVTRE